MSVIYSVLVNQHKIALVQGDITHEKTDAIVNAASSILLGGGGVDGAIHRAAGKQLLEACKSVKATLLKSSGGMLPTGQAVLTNGFNLPAKYVIHTVGPIYQKENNPGELLHQAYLNSLELAEKNKIRSIAFPSIGTGVYGCPIEWAAPIALTTIKDFLDTSTIVDSVRMVLFSERDYEVYKQTLASMMNED